MVEHSEPPLRLALGADALQMMCGKLAEVTQEWAAWEALSVSTTFPAM